MAYTQPTTMVAPPVMMANGMPGMPRTDWTTAWGDVCAPPGGCNQCCYVFCCMSCAYGKIAGSLPPGRRVLSAAHLRACNFFKEHLAWRCSRWPNAPHAIYSACLAGNECGACVSYAAVGGLFYAAGTLFFGMGALAMGPIIGTFTALMHAPMRQAFKANHGILTGENDCLLAWCCDPCIMCQELRELDARRPMVVMVNPGYVQPVQMVMQQQGMQQQYQPAGYGQPVAPTANMPKY